MKNRLTCLEGTLDFEEEIRTQCINIISFSHGQPINVTRDNLFSGQTFSDSIELQIDHARRAFNAFSLVKMEEVGDVNLAAEVRIIIFTFITGAGKKVWQATFALCFNRQGVMNFTCVYPDEASMIKEIGRLHHCVKHFVKS